MDAPERSNAAGGAGAPAQAPADKRDSLASLMRPRSVAVLGASPRPGAVGNTAVRNLLGFGFTGQIYPIHPSAHEVCGIRAYPDLRSLPEIPDCAAVAISADKAVPALGEAAALGVKGAVLFASGFAETGPEGQNRQRELQEISRRAGLAVCGPNCLGLANITDRISLYSAALPEHIQSGGVAVISHSGSGCIVISNLGRFGFSFVISAGNSAVLDVAEYLEFLAEDGRTKVAALFVETIRDPARFAAAAARMHAAGKPIVALKAGHSEKGAAATAAHTGSLAGSQDVYRDYFRRYGVIAVDDFDELVESVALMLSVRKRPAGRGLGVINVSGGEIALTCDIAQRIGLDLPELAPASTATIQAALPSFGTASNPLDATGTAVFDMTMYGACIKGLASDPAIAMVAVSQDCPLNLGAQQAATYSNMAATVASVAAALDKPLVFYSNVAAGVHPRVAAPLVEAGVPVLQGARASLLAVRRLFEYAALREIQLPQADTTLRNPHWVERLRSGQAFTEREAKTFLADHGVAVTRERLATSAAEAVAAAAALSYPVVLKIESAEIAHKSDIGGVKLGLRDAGEVAAAYDAIIQSVRSHLPQAKIAGVLVQEMVSGGTEVIVGLGRQDPFGMAVVVGAGGVLVELVRDSALALAPIDQQRAAGLVQETKIGQILRGYRGSKPADLDALAALLARLSELAVAYGDLIDGLDLNPVVVGEAGRGVRVVDALLVPRRPTV